MSNKCEWRDKPGGPEICGTLRQAGSKFCPRHTFLANVAQQKNEDKQANKIEAGIAGVDKKLPATRRGMIERGYVYTGNNTCSGCGAAIEWWKTPNQRSAPFDPMPLEYSFSRSHFATCTRRADFRKAS